MDFHSSSIKQVTQELKTDIKVGLISVEAERRLKKKGLNELPRAKRLTWLTLILNQIKSPLVYLLVIAAVIAFALGEIIDGWIILGAVILSMAFGYLQEGKAEKSLQALRKIVKRTVEVLRDDKEQEIDTVFLVPGDIILLEEGAKVPADARIVFALNLEMDESPLTGEAFPQEKTTEALDVGVPVPDRKNMVYMGTIVTRGRAECIVTGTGIKTELGKIAESLREIKEDLTPLQKRLSGFSKWLSVIILGITTVLFLGGLLRGIDPIEIFLTSVAVAVASIPEGLIAAVSVILAIGMTRLLGHNALVRNMLAAETLGSTTVICSDKTGTITEGKMSFSNVFTVGKDKDYALLMKSAIMSGSARIMNPQDNFKQWELVGEPTEKALLESAVNAGFSKFYFTRLSHFLDEVPFESKIRYRAVLTKGDDDILKGSSKSHLLFATGAPEKIMESSHYFFKDGKEVKLYLPQFKEIQDEYEKMTKSGLRVLAVSYKKVSSKIESFKNLDEKEPVNGMVFVGFIALKDPIRANVQDALRQAKDAGIKVAVITGDHRNTAVAIAREIGIDVSPEHVMEGKQLEHLSDSDLKKAVGKITVYARILPHDKLRIVKALQERGEVVAMTGDGINDAPALKKADIGVAVGTATDVARETSDMVLMDSNFKTIVEAVRQGRIIFDNIKKVITYVLADSFSEVVLIGGSLLIGYFVLGETILLPLIPAQILWTNLVEDGLPTFALAFEPGEKDVMERKPIGSEASLIDKEMKVIIFIVGIITDILLLGTFFYLLQGDNSIEHVRTVIFAMLGFNSLLYIFSIKSLRKSIFSTGILSNKYLIWSVLLGFLMLVLAIYLPFFQSVLQTTALNGSDWLLVLGIGIFEIVSIEVVKMIYTKNIIRKKS